MRAARRLWETLALAWRGPALAGAVLDRRGAGLGRLLLAALVLTAGLGLRAGRELGRALDEAPMLLEQLPRLGLRGGRLWTDPPQTAPLFLKDRAGRELAVLDLEGGTDLREREAWLMVTRTRLLVKGGDGSVQAFPLDAGGRRDEELDKQALAAFLAGPGRLVGLALALPFIFGLALFLLAAELGLLALLALVPNTLYHTRLAGPARLRLGSAALLPSTLIVTVLLAAGLPPGEPAPLALALSLGWTLFGVTAVSAEQARRGRDSVVRT